MSLYSSDSPKFFSRSKALPGANNSSRLILLLIFYFVVSTLISNADIFSWFAYLFSLETSKFDEWGFVLGCLTSIFSAVALVVFVVRPNSFLLYLISIATIWGSITSAIHDANLIINKFLYSVQGLRSVLFALASKALKTNTGIFMGMRIVDDIAAIVFCGLLLYIYRKHSEARSNS